jgi:hypothetical protein
LNKVATSGSWTLRYHLCHTKGIHNVHDERVLTGSIDSHVCTPCEGALRMSGDMTVRHVSEGDLIAISAKPRTCGVVLILELMNARASGPAYRVARSSEVVRCGSIPDELRLVVLEPIEQGPELTEAENPRSVTGQTEIIASRAPSMMRSPYAGSIRHVVRRYWTQSSMVHRASQVKEKGMARPRQPER